MSNLKAYYEKFWDRDHDVSDADVTTPERKRRLLDALRGLLSPGGKVLDLGCGAGKFTAWLHEAGYDAQGMDLSEAALAKARRTFPQAVFSLLKPDGGIPAEPGTFDAAWTTEVIEHIVDVGSFLAEIHRVLKPGGILILTTPYHGRLKNLLVSLLKFDRHFDPEGPHLRFFDRRGLERCLRRAGFRPLSWAGIGRVPLLYRTWFVVAKKTG